MNIGIGGAGSKLASLSSDGSCTIVNVSELELHKIEASSKILAVTHSSCGQFKGSGKNPEVGKIAFSSISSELKSLIKSNIIFTSTGGGTGNGITSVLLNDIAELSSVEAQEKSMFVFVLPYVNRESAEYVDNTITFLGSPVSKAIDSGNTGNMVFFSNKLKFEGKFPEREYNQMMVDSLNNFLAIPVKGEMYSLLDGHIDFEDFNLYKSKPYFNHFCYFPFNLEEPFDVQLKSNYNNLLLPPEETIEAMFLLELPDPSMTPAFYDVVEFFAKENIAPSYGVIHNPDLEVPHITVSILYSRKPKELVADFKQVSESYTRNRIKKSINQHVVLQNHSLDKLNEARKIMEEDDSSGQDIVGLLKRLGKL
ncbi:MAG: hypothetical protein U9O87_05085 [Verrucomicrobiota bacterium]|nr:hypothetical protein [Verrucomicrobiota bacterium]